MMALRSTIYSRNIFQCRCYHSSKLLNSFIPTKIIQTPNRFYSARQIDPAKQKFREVESAKQRILSTSEKDYLISVYPEIIKSLTDEYMHPTSGLKIPASRLIEAFDYNVWGGKQIRGQFVIRLVQGFSSPKKLSDEDFHLACVSAWLTEVVLYFMMDDILDQSDIRRCVPCWYKKEGIGLSALNDAHAVEASVYVLTKKYFGNKPYYGKLMEIFREVTFLSVVGEVLDLYHSKTTKSKDFSNVNFDTQRALTKYKTAVYSVYFPLKLGMAMAGITDESIHKKMDEFAYELGFLLQVQDDNVDLHGDPEITGKRGIDIENGTLTWFLTKALEVGSPEQKAIIFENYGIDDPNCVAKVKGVYNELQMLQLYTKFEEDIYQDIVKRIGNLNIPYPTDMLTDYLNIIYKRKV